MKVRVTVELSDDDRLLLHRHWTGSRMAKKATRSEIEKWITSMVSGALTDYRSQIAGEEDEQ